MQKRYSKRSVWINNAVCSFSPVAEAPYGEVVKLQTMRCLFEAYEHVLSLLENVFTPMFCHSDEVSIYFTIVIIIQIIVLFTILRCQMFTIDVATHKCTFVLRFLVWGICSTQLT